MLVRGLWTGVPHAQRTVTSHTHSWLKACLARPNRARVQIPYPDAKLRLEFQKHLNGKQRHSSNAYSNYAPRGPSQYHGSYGQPPKTRANRLKDVAIGSFLTIVGYLAYVLYRHRQNKRGSDRLREIFSIYDKILAKAEAEDE